MLKLDYPNLRAADNCPCCNHIKQHGLIVCWTCYNFHDFRNGGEAKFKDTLDNFEAQLAKKGSTK